MRKQNTKTAPTAHKRPGSKETYCLVKISGLSEWRLKHWAGKLNRPMTRIMERAMDRYSAELAAIEREHPQILSAIP